MDDRKLGAEFLGTFWLVLGVPAEDLAHPVSGDPDASVA